MSPHLSRLLNKGRIAPVAVILGPRDQRNRQLFWTPEFQIWCREIALRNDARGMLSYGAQLNLAFSEFVSGRPMSSGLARCDPPTGEGIWRIKTTDLRLYGWADDLHCMVLAVGELKRTIMKPGPPKDRHLGVQAVEARRQLNLDWKRGERYEIFPACS